MFTEMFPLCPDPHCDQRMMSVCKTLCRDVWCDSASQSRLNAELTLNAAVKVLILRANLQLPDISVFVEIKTSAMNWLSDTLRMRKLVDHFIAQCGLSDPVYLTAQ